MVHDQHAPFIAAIIASADDDLPRLVYADWLEETAGAFTCTACTDKSGFCWGKVADCHTCHGTGSNGHAERAEFIRVQCELARMPNCGHEAGWQEQPKLCKGCAAGAPALRRRERELWSAHGETWFGTEFTAAGWVTLENVRRGFMESVEMPWSDFRAHAAAIMAATPLRRVRLTTWPDNNALYEPFAVEFPGIEVEPPQGMPPGTFADWGAESRH